MQDFMEKKQRKDFINMNKLIIATVLMVVVYACKSNNNLNPEPIADVPVNITINMSLPQYDRLLQTNSFIYVDGGIKGVIVVHNMDDNFYAFERSCSYQPRNSCAKIEVDSIFSLFRCGESKAGKFEICCDSKFLFDGEVYAGPATFGLKHYRVFRNGNVLEIKN